MNDLRSNKNLQVGDIDPYGKVLNGENDRYFCKNDSEHRLNLNEGTFIFGSRNDFTMENVTACRSSIPFEMQHFP